MNTLSHLIIGDEDFSFVEYLISLVKINRVKYVALQGVTTEILDLLDTCFGDYATCRSTNLENVIYSRYPIQNVEEMFIEDNTFLIAKTDKIDIVSHYAPQDIALKETWKLDVFLERFQRNCIYCVGGDHYKIWNKMSMWKWHTGCVDPQLSSSTIWYREIPPNMSIFTKRMYLIRGGLLSLVVDNEENITDIDEIYVSPRDKCLIS